VNKFIFKKNIKKNKTKCETKFSSKIFQTLILGKKKKKREMKKRKKGKKYRRAYFVITLPFMSPTTQHIFYHLCSNREISGMILIIKSNISSYN